MDDQATAHTDPHDQDDDFERVGPMPETKVINGDVIDFFPEDHDITVDAAGTLVVRTANGSPVLYYAPGTWHSVVFKDAQWERETD